MKDPKVEVEQLVKEYLIMLYGKKPFYKKSDYFKVKKVVLLCVSKQFELLRYLGSKTSEELYNDLVEQKRLLKYL
jgi:hypothetical protein